MKRGKKYSANTQHSTLNIHRRSKRGQTTIFIILGIVIFVFTIAIYSFVAKPKIFFKGIEEDPQKYIQLCLEDDLTELIDTVSRQGGSLDPEFYYEYHGEKITTLCYTSENFRPCVLQQPFLKQHIEKELLSGIKTKVGECFEKLKTDYEKEGYVVELEKHEPKVSLLPRRIVLEIENKLLLTKETTSEYSEFNVPVYSDLYKLVGIASAMLEWEVKLGDVQINDFMSIYYDLNIKKFRGSNDRKIYTIIKRDTGEEFKFATRSLVFPAGLM